MQEMIEKKRERLASLNAYAQAHAENFLRGYGSYWLEIEVSRTLLQHTAWTGSEKESLEEKSSPNTDRGRLVVED